jgi:hypothetical protein
VNVAAQCCQHDVSIYCVEDCPLQYLSGLVLRSLVVCMWISSFWLQHNTKSSNCGDMFIDCVVAMLLIVTVGVLWELLGIKEFLHVCKHFSSSCLIL